MKFQENPSQTLGNATAKICQYLERNLCQGATFVPGKHFFVDLGAHISESLQWIFLKLRRLSKFGTVNRKKGIRSWKFNFFHKEMYDRRAHTAPVDYNEGRTFHRRNMKKL